MITTALFEAPGCLPITVSIWRVPSTVSASKVLSRTLYLYPVRALATCPATPLSPGDPGRRFG